MFKCTELSRYGNKSVIEIRDIETNLVKKYVVASNFDNSKAYGNKWINGTYFDIYPGCGLEDQLKNAMMFLYGIEEPKIPYDRVLEFTKHFLETLRETDYEDDDDLREYLTDEFNITKEEADLFGILDVCFSKKFKIVKCIMTRRQTVTVKIIMPEDESEYNSDSYIDTYNLEDSYDLECEDWELDSYDVIDDDLTSKDYEHKYDGNEIYNDDDFRSEYL